MDQREVTEVQMFAHFLSLQVSDIHFMIKQTKMKIKPKKQMAILGPIFLFSWWNSQEKKEIGWK